MDIGEMTTKMRGYFKACTDSAKTPEGKMLPKPQRKIASLAGLAMDLGMFKDEVMAMEGGTEEQRIWFKDMMQRFEIYAFQLYPAFQQFLHALTGLYNTLSPYES